MQSVKTDVVIVGAGPTGLSLACQLSRYNIDFVIIDKKESTTPFSKAIGVQARTLEIYEQIGLADKLIAQGSVAGKVRLIEGGQARAELDLTNIGAGLSPYPYLLIVEQGKHEAILHEFLRRSGKEVLWETELTNFSQEEREGGGVRATVKTVGGETKTIEAKFLVGCDGATSIVRDGLGLGFEGSTFERLFYVADVEIDWKFGHDALMVCLAQSTITAFFPLPGNNRFRIVGTFPAGHEKDEKDILYEEIERQIKADTELQLNIRNVNWFSAYKVHTRHVSRFARGRCFLAGDSAHIHTPAGAQGMNTGIQDGYNLAWKLARVIKGIAGHGLLETYNEERLENARNLLKTTDRLFQFGASPETFLAYFRTHVLPYIANFVLSIEPVKKFIFPRISQIGINYRGSYLSQEGSLQFSVKAGDRMPFFLVDNSSIYDRLRAPKFHLLVFTDGQTSVSKPALAEDFDFASLPLYPHIAALFGATKTFAVFVRPDNYIGLITAADSTDALTKELQGYVQATRG
jgi:2-polyprenyl-6-methoxyphenol hydroxylase-like FAD-dependent oxidoreductase